MNKLTIEEFSKLSEEEQDNYLEAVKSGKVDQTDLQKIMGYFK